MAKPWQNHEGKSAGRERGPQPRPRVGKGELLVSSSSDLAWVGTRAVAALHALAYKSSPQGAHATRSTANRAWRFRMGR